MASTIDSDLFRDQFSTPEMRAVFDDRSTLQRWLDTEAALARAEAALGLVPDAAAEEIGRAADASLYDLAAIKAEMDRTAHPIVPLVRAMAARCGGGAGAWVHWGATTQDILDTGLVLQMKAATDLLARDLAALEGLLAGLAREHRTTPMAGRTHGQQALPITFGYKLAVWIDEVRRHRARLRDMRPRVLVGQFSGAVGTFAAIGAPGPEVAERMMADLGLGAPAISRHVAKDGVVEFACTVAMIAGSMGKIAHEIATLQRTEIGELEEPFPPGKVGSSTMPQKRNPAICEAIQALARAAKACVLPAFDGLVAENERDKVANEGERDLVSRVCCHTHAALAKTLYVIGGLTVRTGRMRANLDLTGGLLLSERVMMALAARIGRQRAHDLVYEAAMAAYEAGGSFRDRLVALPEVQDAIGPDALDDLLDPAAYTGLAAELCDRVLAAAD